MQELLLLMTKMVIMLNLVVVVAVEVILVTPLGKTKEVVVPYSGLVVEQQVIV